jgi:hypothetical protein
MSIIFEMFLSCKNFVFEVFAAHAFVAICVVCYIKDDMWYFVNFTGICFLAIEGCFTSFLNNGKDLNW